MLYAALCLLMLALGASDAARGVLAPVFADHFKLDASGVSAIITAGYIGNFFFLLFGGEVLDRISARMAQLLFWACWMVSLLLMALTDNFILLLIGMAGALGASTMLNTSMGLIVPAMETGHAAFLVSFLFFVQGIGTSMGQSALGNWAVTFRHWHVALCVLMTIGTAAAVGMLRGNYPKSVHKQQRYSGNLWRDKRFYLLIGIFGLYFIAEHGMLNWFVSYAVSWLGMQQGEAANVLAMFSAGIMAGRLLLGPLADYLGVKKIIPVMMMLAFAMYLTGTLLGKNGLWLIGASGIAFSVLYPVLVMCIGKTWGQASAGGAGGKILSIASLADIGFNAVFGSIVQIIGYKGAFLLMPLSLGLCFLLSLRFFAVSEITAEKPAEKP